jgi:glucose 1-dehydrogenase
MIDTPVEFLVDLDDASQLTPFEPPLRTAPLDWLNLLDALAEPAALIEKGLSDLGNIQRGGIRQPRKVAVVGTNRLGLLATLALRLRGAKVVTLGGTFPPVLSPKLLKGIAGWKHVWMSPALVRTQLVEETGARYVCTSELTLDDAAHQYGPFDMIIVGSADSPPIPSPTKGLAENGALVDLSLGDGAIEIWAAASKSNPFVRRRAMFQVGGDGRVYTNRATRNLALAEVRYPGWLARLLKSFETPRDAGPLSTLLQS